MKFKNPGLKERVLQNYIIHNFSKLKIRPHGKKIIHVDDQADQYPDLYFVLDDNTRIPVEVEWKTSKFDHPISVLSENNGVIIVLNNDIDIGRVPVYELDPADFEKWFVQNAQDFIHDTVTPHKKSEKEHRPYSKLWFSYLSLKAGGVSDFDVALEHQTWGIPSTYNPTTENQITDIQKGDLIAFIGPGKHFPGRVKLKIWQMKNFKGTFEKIQVYRITRGYYPDFKNTIWKKNSGKHKDEVYPHRFKFDRNPILVMKNIKIKKLTATTKLELHTMVYSNLRPADPSSLVDIMSNAE